jgi:hypothetical protein
MMSASRARQQPQSRPADRRALGPIGREYDDNLLRGDDVPEGMLPGQDVASLFTVDDADESGGERRFELADAEFIDEDITVAVIPKRADEFTCTNCFLIQHLSRLASSAGGRPICVDCA